MIHNNKKIMGLLADLAKGTGHLNTAIGYQSLIYDSFMCADRESLMVRVQADLDEFLLKRDMNIDMNILTEFIFKKIRVRRIEDDCTSPISWIVRSSLAENSRILFSISEINEYTRLLESKNKLIESDERVIEFKKKLNLYLGKTLPQ